jgi:hypothetical protein
MLMTDVRACVDCESSKVDPRVRETPVGDKNRHWYCQNCQRMVETYYREPRDVTQHTDPKRGLARKLHEMDPDELRGDASAD